MGADRPGLRRQRAGPGLHRRSAKGGDVPKVFRRYARAPPSLLIGPCGVHALLTILRQPAPMPLYAYSINDTPEAPDVRTGYIRAADAQEAVRLVGDARVNVYALSEAPERPRFSEAVKAAGDVGEC